MEQIISKFFLVRFRIEVNEKFMFFNFIIAPFFGQFTIKVFAVFSLFRKAISFLFSLASNIKDTLFFQPDQNFFLAIIAVANYKNSYLSKK